jgi:hypothetical protein
MGEVGGVFCERLFGPVHDGRCACGALGGPRGRAPIAEGERCTKCKVEATRRAVRNERWAHVSLPTSVFHPACIPVIAELAGLPEDDVRAMAWREAHLEGGRVVRAEDPHDVSLGGLDELVRRLAEARGPAADALRAEGFDPQELLLDRVPVTPPGARPRVKMPGGHRMPEARSLAFADLVGRAGRLRRLAELNAPDLFLRTQSAALQEAFERILVGPRGAPWIAEEDDGGGTLVASPPSDDETWMSPPDPTRPVGAAFVGESGVLVQFPRTVVHLDLGGAVLDVFEAPRCMLLGVDEEGRHALFHGGGFHVRDLHAHAFLERVPESFPGAFMDEVLEQAFLVDGRRSRRIRLYDVEDYPVFEAFSPDGRHVWVEDKEGSGGVYGVESGFREVDGSTLRGEVRPAVLGVDGRLDDDAYEDEAPEYPAIHALVLGPNDRFRIAGGGVIAEDGEVMMILPAPAPVVAFAHDGAAVLVVRRDHAAIVGLDPPELQERIPLGPLADLLRARAGAPAPA